MSDFILWSPGVTLEAIEGQVIGKAFQFYRGNKSATARALGISIRTLDDKLQKLKLAKDKMDEGEVERNALREKRLRQSRGEEPADPWQPSAVVRNFAAQAAAADSRAQAETGLGAQPAVGSTAQQPVPLSQRQEVQDVPPARTANVHPGRARR